MGGVDVRIKSIKNHWAKVLRYNGGSFGNNEERFLDAFHASPVALCITSIKDAICLEINKSAEELLGYSYEDYAGRAILELNGISLAEIQSIFNQKSLSSKPSEGELHIRTKQGRKKLILFSVEKITLNEEECRLTVFMDITKDR